MKNTILTLSLSLLFISSFAQKHLVGAIGGLNISNALPFSASRYADAERRLAPLFGISYQNMLKERLSFGMDLFYNARGFTEISGVTDQTGDPLPDFNLEYKFNYISLPIKLGYNIGNKIHAFGNIGVVPSFLLNSSIKSPGLFTSQAVLTHRIDNITSISRRFDVGGLIEFGGGVKFETIWTYMSIGYQPSLIGVLSSDQPNTPFLTLHGLLVSIGMRYVMK